MGASAPYETVPGPCQGDAGRGATPLIKLRGLGGLSFFVRNSLVAQYDVGGFDGFCEVDVIFRQRLV